MPLGKEELPPRTRRILFEGEEIAPEDGTTSAHAENTTGNVRKIVVMGNYLRARGEYICAYLDMIQIGELPPRTRRIHRIDKE